MTKFSEIWKKYLFLPNFRSFLRITLKNPALQRTTSRDFLSPCRKLEKTNDRISRKLSDRHTDVWTLPATAGGQIKNFDSLPIH